jgi:hypothetical protein
VEITAWQIFATFAGLSLRTDDTRREAKVVSSSRILVHDGRRWRPERPGEREALRACPRVARAELAREGSRIVAVICGACGRATVATRLWIRRAMAAISGQPAREALGAGESTLACFDCHVSIEADAVIEAEARRLESEFDRIMEQPPFGPWNPGLPREGT